MANPIFTVSNLEMDEAHLTLVHGIVVLSLIKVIKYSFFWFCIKVCTAGIRWLVWLMAYSSVLMKTVLYLCISL